MSGGQMRIGRTPCHASARQNPGGFTLIELLVVISILVSLMAILLPTLRAARDQARAVACQGKLRQWGVLFQTEMAGNDGPTSNHHLSDLFREDHADDPNSSQRGAFVKRYAPAGMDLCPRAARLSPEQFQAPEGFVWGYGSTFFAEWYRFLPSSQTWAWSYGINYTFAVSDLPHLPGTYNWARLTGLRCAAVPVISDCICSSFLPTSDKRPAPPYEDCRNPSDASYTWQEVCLNRHQGGVNHLFLDWSARRVGLKELWTLKWMRDFNTAGPWTKAGGVQPEDWPPWMRRFKDY